MAVQKMLCVVSQCGLLCVRAEPGSELLSDINLQLLCYCGWLVGPQAVRVLDLNLRLLSFVLVKTPLRKTLHEGQDGDRYRVVGCWTWRDINAGPTNLATLKWCGS